MTVAADVTITHVEADDLGHTMMLQALRITVMQPFSQESSSVNTLWQETKKLMLPAAVPSLEQELEGTGTFGGIMNLFILHLSNIAVVAL